jgi:hypothetical protein
MAKPEIRQANPKKRLFKVIPTKANKDIPMEQPIRYPKPLGNLLRLLHPIM